MYSGIRVDSETIHAPIPSARICNGFNFALIPIPVPMAKPVTKVITFLMLFSASENEECWWIAKSPTIVPTTSEAINPQVIPIIESTQIDL